MSLRLSIFLSHIDLRGHILIFVSCRSFSVLLVTESLSSGTDTLLFPKVLLRTQTWTYTPHSPSDNDINSIHERSHRAYDFNLDISLVILTGTCPTMRLTSSQSRKNLIFFFFINSIHSILLPALAPWRHLTSYNSHPIHRWPKSYTS